MSKMIQQPLADHSFTKKDVCHALFYFYCQSHSRQRSAFRKLVCQNPQLFFYSKYRFRDLPYCLPQDALQFVRSYPARKDNVPICFVACGGDGILHEVVNGAAGRTDCTVSVIPCGSGNDYVKNFGSSDAFTDLERLAKGTLIRWTCWTAPVNMPLTCATSGLMRVWHIICPNSNEFHLFPVVGLHIIFTVLHLRPISSTMTISHSGEEPLTEKLILAVVANGYCYGGGYYPVPDACATDGIMEFCGVRKCPGSKCRALSTFIEASLHLNNPQLAAKILYQKANLSPSVGNIRWSFVWMEKFARKKNFPSTWFLPPCLFGSQRGTFQPIFPRLALFNVDFSSFQTVWRPHKRPPFLYRISIAHDNKIPAATPTLSSNTSRT